MVFTKNYSVKPAYAARQHYAEIRAVMQFEFPVSRIHKGGQDMFIHLGGEKIIRTQELIAIFDLSVEKTLFKPCGS